MDDRIAHHLAEAPPHWHSVRFTDQAGVAANLATLRAAAGDGPQLAGVVKADCYGLGLANVLPILWDGGVRTFFVAHIGEGFDLLAQLEAFTPHVLDETAVYVLNGLPAPQAARACIESGLRPVIGSAQHLHWWLDAPGARGAPMALHIDTGMTRLGFIAEDLSAMRQEPGLAACHVALIMSHFACADDPDHPMNERQRALFDEAVGALSPHIPSAQVCVSLANAPATLANPAARYDLVRPGIALYGGRSAPVPAGTLQPVAHVYARVAQVQTLTTSRAVSYGATQRVNAGTRLATVNYGYADGYPRAASSTDAAPGGYMALNG
ncbi:MAG: alanine racemase, partial [Pseudomonadota bacterium]